MEFNPDNAVEIGFETTFNPANAVEEVPFNPENAVEFTPEIKHDWGTTDARDAGKVNPGMSAPERKGSKGERTGLVMQRGFAMNPITGRRDGSLEASYVKDMEDWFKKDPKSKTPDMVASVEAHRKQAISKLSKYIALRMDMDADIQDVNPSLDEHIVGGIIPSLPDPLNAVPVAKGAKLATTALKGAIGGLGLGIVSAWEQGQYDKSIGLIKQDPEFKQLLESGFDTAMIVAAISSAMHIRGNYHAGIYDKKTGIKSDPVLDAEAKAFVEGSIPPPDPLRGVDTTKIQSPYFNQGEEGGKAGVSPTQAKAINKVNDAAFKEGTNQTVQTSELNNKITNPKAYNQPYWPDEELQGAIKSANKEAQVRENFDELDTNPDLDAMLRRGPDESAETMADPLAAKTLDEAKSDMAVAEIDAQQPKNPYMSEDELLRSQALADRDGYKAGHSEMEIPAEAGNIPYWRDLPLEKAKAAANRAASLRGRSKKQGGYIDNEPAEARRAVDLFDPKYRVVLNKHMRELLGEELKDVYNVSDAVWAAIKFEPDLDIREMALRLSQLAGKSDNFFAMGPDTINKLRPDHNARMLLEGHEFESAGIHNTDVNGRKSVYIRNNEFGKKSAVSPEVIFHEAIHNVSDHAFIIASDPVLRNKPEYAKHVAFADSINELMQAAQREGKDLPNGFSHAFEKGGHEFANYSWSSKEFRDWLKGTDLKYYGKSAWEQVKTFFANLLGMDVKSTNALTAIDSFFKRLDDIQKYDKQDIGMVIAKNNKKSSIVPTNMAKKEGGWISRESSGGPRKRYETAEEALKASVKDFGQEKLIPMTMNQKAEFLDHPAVSFVYDSLRKFANEADVRFNMYKHYLTDVEEFLKKERSQSLKMLKGLADIQNPELKDARQLAEDTNTREQFLRDQGMAEEHIPMAIKILNVMKAVGYADQQNAYKHLGHNFSLEPMYFPREHTGPFTVSIVDEQGKLVYMRGFENSAMAQKAKASLARQLKDRTEYVVDIQRNEPNSLAELYNMLNMNPDNVPEFVKSITDGMLKEIEVAKRKFEMERAAHNIPGYTGEVIYDHWNPLSSKHQSDTKVLTLLQRRLEQSFALETKARLLGELKTTLLDDPFSALHTQPNAKRMVQQMLARDLGISISEFHSAGRRADAMVEGIGKAVNKVMAGIKGYEASDVSYFQPQELARMAQVYTWTMSMFKLGLSPSTLMANTSTMLTTPIDGVRTAAKEGVSQTIPALATIKMLASHLDPEAMKWMKDVASEGMVEARISDPLTITNTHARGAIDRVVNVPRDLIEKGTNYSSLLYYYNFYKLAYPDLAPTSREFKSRVYEAVRSWTGDYTHQAQLIGISQAGDAGHLMSNFAKWKYNQLGRLSNDVKDLGAGKVMPLITTLALTTLMAGAVGAPIAVEYEALRRLGMKTGWWDWKPLSGFLYELKDKGQMPDWAIKGPLFNAMDMAGKEFGVTTPDLSSNIRHSSFLDVSTLPVQFFMDQVNLTGTAVKQLVKLASNAAGGSYPGATVQQQKDAIKGVPVVLENVLRVELEDKISNETNVAQYTSKDAGRYRRTGQEKALAYLGLKGKDEGEFMDRDYNKSWNERNEKNKMSKLTDEILANLDNPKVIQGRAEKIFELKGMKGIEEAIARVQEVQQARATDAQERGVLSALSNPDYVAQAKALQQLKNFRPSK